MTELAKNFVEKAAPEYWYTYAHELADTADQIYRSSKKQFVAYLHEYGDGSTKTERRPLVSRVHWTPNNSITGLGSSVITLAQ